VTATLHRLPRRAPAAGDAAAGLAALQQTLAAHDAGTAEHCSRVARLTALLGEEMGLSSAELEAARVGALVHDIGKLGVPARVLVKAGPLDDRERAHVRRHPELSERILARAGLPPAVLAMARSHHERFGGGGYPDGLAGEEIPLAARILSVADALDAMTCDRPYRRALSLVEALDEIARNTPAQFCPRVVRALHRCLARREAVAALGGG
jgi:putative nucleotidyltransferase with HDIG domain